MRYPIDIFSLAKIFFEIRGYISSFLRRGKNTTNSCKKRATATVKISTVKLKSFIRVIISDYFVLLEFENVSDIVKYVFWAIPF